MQIFAIASTALVVPMRPTPSSLPHLRATPPTMQMQQFDFSEQTFDVLSLRTFRRDTILQYEATNQSEPLRIALCFFGVLFSLCIPTLFDRDFDGLTTTVAAVMGTGISGTLFQRNRYARSQRMGKIDLEYQMGDLRATYRGARTNKLSELRGKRRVVAVVGPTELVAARMCEARVYRRRLSAADAVIVPVYTDERRSYAPPPSEAESKWLWAAADPSAWIAYFNTLLASRGMASIDQKGAWLGLNVKGRSFGSALGAPRWDELLGTALQPQGDTWGELKDASMGAAEAAKEAATAAASLEGKQADPAGEEEAAAVLGAQEAFYTALCGGDVEAMGTLWAGSGVMDDESVSEAMSAGAKVEPWAAGSQAFPPKGMRATDRDCLVVSGSEEAYTTAIERPPEGGTLLATQRFKLIDGAWKIVSHRYIPWSADGATAVATLRCDSRGCVLLGREINTRETVQKGAVLPVL